MCLFCVLILPNCPLFVCVLNASSNLKRSLHLGTKIKSNGWLDIETEGIYFNVLMLWVKM